MGEGSRGEDTGPGGSVSAAPFQARGPGVRRRRCLQWVSAQCHSHCGIRVRQAPPGLDQLFPEGAILSAARALARFLGRNTGCVVLFIEPRLPAGHRVVNGREDQGKGGPRKRRGGRTPAHARG